MTSSAGQLLRGEHDFNRSYFINKNEYFPTELSTCSKRQIEAEKVRNTIVLMHSRFRDVLSNLLVGRLYSQTNSENVTGSCFFIIFMQMH